MTGDGCARAVVPRAPEPRGERAEVARAERRARQTHGAHERERSWYVRIAWEETVRKRVSGRRGRRDEERTSRRSDGPGRFRKHRTTPTRRGDRRACALRERRLRRRTRIVEATVAVLLEIVSEARAHLRRKRRRAIRARVPAKPPLRANAHPSRTRAEAKPPRRWRARAWRPRAHPTGGTLDPFDDAVERAPRDWRRGFASPARAVLCPARRIARKQQPAARGLQNRLKCRFFAYVFLVWKKSYY